MPPRSWALCGAALTALLLAPPVACVDLFHSTAFQTACDVDAAACPTLASPGDGGPTNFCEWSHLTAHANALRACAWLGACAGPVGENAFGPCVVRATLAYDCAASPNRALVPGSAAHAFWDRLWQANRCADVMGASFPPKVAPACGPSPTSYATCFPDSATLLSCGEDGGTPSTLSFENCAAFGQTCATSGAMASCAGSSTTCSTVGASCSGTELHDCDADGGTFDLGVDCASVGAASCVDVGTLSACKPAGSPSCAPSVDITCDDAGAATGCPSGYSERVDCSVLLGVPASCAASAPGRSWDVSRACTVGPCGPDTCGGSSASLLNGCARGATVSVDCAELGFSGCTTVLLPGDPMPRAVCSF